jgi:NAD-dependent SIR2 family protein deacetylase
MNRAATGPSAELERLVALLAGGDVFVLTGAGASTDSGIPDYRDERGAWKHRAPMQIREFMGSLAARRRYWARSLVGYMRLARALPNAAHHALAELERRGRLSLTVTQNVDGLHEAAGSRDVLDLHGRIDRVICLGCRRTLPRLELQAALARENPDWSGRHADVTPDGDAELGAVDYSAFRVVDCAHCGGILKPDVVFFGEGVPRPQVERALAALERSRALLVVGSSLMVFSGFRFARHAAALGLPIAIVNRGVTRADELSGLRIAANAGEILASVLARLPAQDRELTLSS